MTSLSFSLACSDESTQKESMGIVCADMLKGSFYANPLQDVPTSNSFEIQRYITTMSWFMLTKYLAFATFLKSVEIFDCLTESLYFPDTVL